MKKKYGIRKDDLIVAAKVVLEGFKKDIADFENFSPRYNAAFVSELEGILSNISSVSNSVIKMGEQKMVTEQLYKHVDELLPFVYRIEGYVLRAEGMDVGSEDFEIKKVYKKIRSKDVEGLYFELMLMCGNIENNMSQLVAEGYSSAMHDELKLRIETIKNGNVLQNTKMNEKLAAVQNNTMYLNDLYKRIGDIMDAGKRIYKYTNEAKTHEYTWCRILRMMNRRSGGRKKK